jgi:hypothetical protein
MASQAGKLKATPMPMKKTDMDMPASPPMPVCISTARDRAPAPITTWDIMRMRFLLPLSAKEPAGRKRRMVGA